jgi:hypothetical protein
MSRYSGSGVAHFLNLTMSCPSTHVSEVGPDESISQINFNIDKENIYGDSMSYSTLMDPSASEGARVPNGKAAYFIVTVENLTEGRSFLKVDPRFQAQTNGQNPWLEFIFRFQGEQGRQRCEAWGEFHEGIHLITGLPIVICMHCRELLPHPWKKVSKPTTRLNSHIKDCRAYQHRHHQETGGATSSSVAEFFSTYNRRCSSLTKLQIEDQVLKFFISANIPFRQLENEHFRELVSWININGHPARSPSRKIIRARLTSHAILAKENLKILLKSNKSKISVALDCWMSHSNFGFLGLLLYEQKLIDKPLQLIGSMITGTSKKLCWTFCMLKVIIMAKYWLKKSLKY